MNPIPRRLDVSNRHLHAFTLTLSHIFIKSCLQVPLDAERDRRDSVDYGDSTGQPPPTPDPPEAIEEDIDIFATTVNPAVYSLEEEERLRRSRNGSSVSEDVGTRLVSVMAAGTRGGCFPVHSTPQVRVHPHTPARTLSEICR